MVFTSGLEIEFYLVFDPKFSSLGLLEVKIRTMCNYCHSCDFWGGGGLVVLDECLVLVVLLVSRGS